MARIIGVMNEKGGTGKTTMAFNIASCFAENNKKVLFIDMDGQRANASFMAGVSAMGNKLTTMYDVLINGENIKKAVLAADDNFHIIPATTKCVEINRSNCTVTGMKNAIDLIREHYDLIFIDVPPSPTQHHVLCASVADYVLIPMDADPLPYEAIKGMGATITTAKKTVNPNIKCLGICINKYDWRTRLTRDVISAADKVANAIGSKVLDTKIRRNVAIAEASGQKMSVTSYAPNSNGAKDIRALCAEIEKEMEHYEQNL